MSDESLPNSWTSIKLAEVGQWRGGGTPSKANPAFWTNGTIPWVSPKDMKQPRLSTAQDLITESAVESSATNLIEAGSVLLVTRSGILAHSLPVAVNLVPVALNQDIKAVTPHEITDAEYLRLIFQCFERDILNTCRKGGTTVHSIEFPALQDFSVPLPPLAEQKRIVAKIEELFSELEAGEESLRVARRQLGVYRQSLLKQAFEGKLTAQWRTQNSAQLESPAQLLARIQSARQARYEQQLKRWESAVRLWESGGEKGKRPTKPKRPPAVSSANPLSTSDDAARIPAEWQLVRLEEISDQITDGTHHTPTYTPDGIPFISVKDIRDRRVYFDDCKYISRDEHSELCERCRPEPGDVLITKSGTIGRLAIAPEVDFSLFVSVALIKTQSLQGHVMSDWMLLALEYHVLGLDIDQDIKGGLLKNYHLEDLRLARVPLCSLPEQQEIVRLLDEQFEVIERNERELDAALKRSEALRQAILKKAFTGRLVPQAPSDEPASTLLTRLRAERTTDFPARRATRGQPKHPNRNHRP